MTPAEFAKLGRFKVKSAEPRLFLTLSEQVPARPSQKAELLGDSVFLLRETQATKHD